MLVLRGGEIEGTIGGGAIEHEICREALEAMDACENRFVERHLTHELAMCCGGGMKVFIEVQTYAPQCYVFGCGHVGVELAQLAATCGFAVKAIDSRVQRTDLLTEQALPTGGSLKVCCEEPLDLVPSLVFDEDTYGVVVTHDHALDEELVAALLGQPGAYLGCIGSVRKAHKFRQRLAARGFSQEDIARMRTPMGLEIGALTPAEIALSTVAEMVSVRRGRAHKSEAG